MSGSGGEEQRWRVLLMLEDGYVAAGYWEHVGVEPPLEGAVITVRDTREKTLELLARVHHVDEESPLPIAAVEVFPS